jgi:predicted transposase/invertase (TIGR01784 family)
LNFCTFFDIFEILAGEEAAMGVNRSHKDSVFSWLFSDPDVLRELYSAIEGIPVDPDTPITINTLESALYKGFVNDISFVIEDKIVVLIEHQSTINENMPLRLLLYVAELYKQLTGDEDLYREKRIPIPRPEFIILYNGTKSYDDQRTLRLSDAFKDASSLAHKQDDGPELELTVKVYNINKGCNESIIRKCKMLNWYSTFIAKVREYKTKTGDDNEAMSRAVKYCIEHDILKDFLKLHSKEIINMLITEWNWDTALKVRGEEGREEGREETAKNMLLDNLPPDKIAQYTKLPVETIQRLASTNSTETAGK